MQNQKMRIYHNDITCHHCNFQGRWDDCRPCYKPAPGCHKSKIEPGWCESCDAVTSLYTGKADRYELSDYDVDLVVDFRHRNEERPWEGVETQINEWKKKIDSISLSLKRKSGVVARTLFKKQIRSSLDLINWYTKKIEEAKPFIEEYKLYHKKALKDSSEASIFFGNGRQPRCLECGSLNVHVGFDGLIPHSCGEFLDVNESSYSHAAVLSFRVSYYDNNGLIVNTETSNLYSKKSPDHRN